MTTHCLRFAAFKSNQQRLTESNRVFLHSPCTYYRSQIDLISFKSSMGVCVWIGLMVVGMLYVHHAQAQPKASVAKVGCQDHCGDVEIPFPFGIEMGCALSHHFMVNCDDPSKPTSHSLQLDEIMLTSGKIRSLMSISYVCYDQYGDITSENQPPVGHEEKSFLFSSTDNIFTAVGCDTVAFITGTRGTIYTGGCISLCANVTDAKENECSGIGCCKSTIPNGLGGFKSDIQSQYNHTEISGNNCSYAFLAEKNSPYRNYTFQTSHLESMDKNQTYPIICDWVVDDRTCEEAQKNITDYKCVSDNSACVDSPSGHGYFCNCKEGYDGTPYLKDGCQDINECADNICGEKDCENTDGSYICSCPHGFSSSDPTIVKDSSCVPVENKSKGLVVGILIAIASALLTSSVGIWIYLVRQKRRLAQLKHRHFHQNGGFLLERKIASKHGISLDFKLYTKEEVDYATNNYDQTKIIGRGGQGVVYKGNFRFDPRTFAIKKSMVVDGSKVDEFVNEIAILSQINHRNVVKLLGCCLEVEDPLLVYEYIPNGTLYQQIQAGSLPWQIRVSIAAGTASALAYLHSSISVPIIHRDVKSSNILVDLDYAAKVSDFGASRSIPINEVEVTTLVQGTLGYLDPEYMLTHQLTKKSDVYSFGVVLVELLTGLTPLSYERAESERSIAMLFVSAIKDGRIDQILDPTILKDHTTVVQMKQVADIAALCLKLKGEDRPSMTEISMELETLRTKITASGRRGWISKYTQLRTSEEQPFTTNSSQESAITDHHTTTTLEDHYDPNISMVQSLWYR